MKYYGNGFAIGALIGATLFLIFRSRRRHQAYAGPVPPRLPGHQGYSPDVARADFLARLSGAPVALTPWEDQFVENNVGRVCYTQRQRVVINGLRTKYGASLERGPGAANNAPPSPPGWGTKITAAP